jgi:hypothetical protein
MKGTPLWIDRGYLGNEQDGFHVAALQILLEWVLELPSEDCRRREGLKI